MNPDFPLSPEDLNSLIRLYMMLEFAGENDIARQAVLDTLDFLLKNKSDTFVSICDDILNGTNENSLTAPIRHFGDVSLSYNPY